MRFNMSVIYYRIRLRKNKIESSIGDVETYKGTIQKNYTDSLRIKGRVKQRPIMVIKFLITI